MKFTTAATTNPIDRLRVVGKPADRIDGPLKTTGTAPYAYEQHAAVPGAVYGHVVGAAIAKGRIAAIDTAAARRAPGVIAVVTHENAGKLGLGNFNTARLLGGPEIDHYHQAIALVVAETFEQARAAASLVKADYVKQQGSYDLAAAMKSATSIPRQDVGAGDFEGGFAAAPVRLDATYTTPDQTHAMMEPYASTARWDGDKLTVWTSNQMINWTKNDLAKTLGIPAENVRLVSPYIGGGFGGKLFLRAEALLAALGARVARRPVKVTMQRALIINNTTHRPATIQRIRIGATREGRISAIAHESWSGNLPDGKPETAVQQTRLLYAGANRMTRLLLATLDLPEGNAMRAPGEAPGLMALEIAMDEMAEKLKMDPVTFRIINDTTVDPQKRERRFSQRRFVECLRQGADRFAWKNRSATPGKVRDGRWLVGMGVASAFRNNMNMKSAARVRLERDGTVTVETDMTDIGTGSYTIIAQTAAEMLGLPIERIAVRLGDSDFPVSAGSGGQWGANSSTAGVYAACVKLREEIARKAGLDVEQADFTGGVVAAGGRSMSLRDVAANGEIAAEDTMEYGDLARHAQQSTFGAHFVEVGVDIATAEIRIRRMLAVCAAGRILNPKTARSQVIGAMTMGVGGAIMEALAVDKRLGFFVNHDLAGYEVPVHADIPHQEVIFLDEVDAMTSPMKAKGVGELGLCGVSAAVANAIHNATGIRVRDYPVTLDKLLDKMPALR
ncbi:aldehyde oxidoreductase molybdenum-binding subunit PaoC [Pseudoduganella umbonata]|uniref:Xanthine dehydrogenase YagR molybdenum-binding subunit n=1 Tax=Pseudoduganella umbonata TaxID=864828 RepID=A0A4V1ECX8_9BURK|nr:aldehyde oxidoreductase molybdenum-binding subunit PaoC [Pseudoduganella umbonata]MBB3221639.1 xanthine dehydrogenase YagR molybdenum-binding subunit [Pseudoduganella umbonata]QCP09131.1 xanthine dehydrogenase family protein molybdopterin-binding subunit [Pseudoduganella umbonata]